MSEQKVEGFELSLASVDAYDPQSFIDGAKWQAARQSPAPIPEQVAPSAASLKKLSIQNDDGGAYMVESEYGEFYEVEAVNRLLANQSAKEVTQQAAKAEPVRYEMRLVAPAGYPGPWDACDKGRFEKFKAQPNVGDGFTYEVRALCLAPTTSTVSASSSERPTADKGAAHE